MKKLSLLVGTLGGAMAGYLFSNKKLRDEMANAKDPEEAAKILGKHLQKDGKKIAKQAREFVESDEVQANISKAKKYTDAKVKEAKGELKKMVNDTKKEATKTAKKTMKNAKKSAKKATVSTKKNVQKAKTVAKKTTKKAVTKGKARMRTRTRKLR